MIKKLTKNWLMIDWKIYQKEKLCKDFVKWIKFNASTLNISLKNWLKID